MLMKRYKVLDEKNFFETDCTEEWGKYRKIQCRLQINQENKLCLTEKSNW